MYAAHPADDTCLSSGRCFFYVLVCNLLGAFPWLGSPTGDINVTRRWRSSRAWPSLCTGRERRASSVFGNRLAPGDGPVARLMKIVLVPVIWVIEFAGFIIKHGVLAIRLFANMMGGHTVVAVIMLFIAIAAHSGSSWLYPVVVPVEHFWAKSLRRASRIAGRVRSSLYLCVPGDGVYRHLPFIRTEPARRSKIRPPCGRRIH